MIFFLFVVVVLIAIGTMTRIDWRTRTQVIKSYIRNYCALVCLGLVIVAVVWEVMAPGRWFYCDDSIGLSFIPPFAHIDVKAYGHNEDRYLIAPSFIYSVWGSLVGAAFLLPALAIVIMSRFHCEPIQSPKSADETKA